MRAFTLIVCALFCMAVAPAPSTQPTVAQKCDALRAKWEGRFKDDGLAYIVSPPFVVAGDGGPQRVRRYLNQTILSAADALHAKFFDRAKPDKPILILLFESDGPYRRLAKKWFDDDDVSRFGYFRHDNVMLMNVGTGTGTLVHELTHALIKPDFPQVPSWFNEGLGSLFEQCTLANNDIRGLANWRLPDLQHAIRRGGLRSLEELVNDGDFYGETHVGMNYAQARYLLMFLQESNRLAPYYRAFRDQQIDDPKGLKQLRAIIALQSLEEFEKDWRRWVLRQRFE
jgi:hypothetical protein